MLLIVHSKSLWKVFDIEYHLMKHKETDHVVWIECYSYAIVHCNALQRYLNLCNFLQSKAYYHWKIWYVICRVVGCMMWHALVWWDKSAWYDETIAKKEAQNCFPFTPRPLQSRSPHHTIAPGCLHLCITTPGSPLMLLHQGNLHHITQAYLHISPPSRSPLTTALIQHSNFHYQHHPICSVLNPNSNKKLGLRRFP